MTPRPIYVGVGECTCKRLDVRLYFVPAAVPMAGALCAVCLAERGYAEPLPRTAADIVSVDDKLEWVVETPTTRADKLELGAGHLFEAVIDGKDQLIGWLHTHPDARNPNVLCQSFCAVRQLNGAPVHQVLCSDPLTLTPSLRCRMCGAHGEVINGKWEPR